MRANGNDLLLQVSGVSKRFGGVQALKDIDVQMREGEVLALIGPNGAGKTTLFNVITGKHTPDSGSIFFRGQLINGLSLTEIARLGIIRVFQKPRVFLNLTVWENLIIGCSASIKDLHTQAEERAEMLLEQFGLTRDRLIPARGLPFGKKRYLELARALGARPYLLLLDEPAAGLSPEEQEMLVNYLRKAATSNGTHLLFIEHCYGVVSALATKVIILNGGQKVFEGPGESQATREAIETLYLRVSHAPGR